MCEAATKGGYSDVIITKIEMLSKFHKAEEDHQDHFNKNSGDFWLIGDVDKARDRVKHLDVY